jgi:5-methylcytosine-specific restriction endonuclease McrA
MSDISSSHWHSADRLKRCILCGEEKPLGDFSAYAYTTAQGKRSTRYESRCLLCQAERQAQRRARNPEQHEVQIKTWRANNPEHLREYARNRQADPNHRANKAKSQRLRKARMRSGQGDDEAIRAIYAEAMRIERIVAACPIFDLPELGHKMHVDHRIPLARGGPHEAWNLQILPIGINLRKGTSCPR